EKSGYTASQVNLQKAGIYRLKGDRTQAKHILAKHEDLKSHSAEYHFQVASMNLSDGDRRTAVTHLEKAVELDPGHTGALFQLVHANALAGNEEEAFAYYERCVRHPPVHIGALMNLGILYEDHEKYQKAEECFRKILSADPLDEQARLFVRD